MPETIKMTRENEKTMVCIPKELLNVVKCLNLEHHFHLEIRNGKSPKVKSFEINDRIEDINWFIRNKKHVKCGGEIIKDNDQSDNEFENIKSVKAEIMSYILISNYNRDNLKNEIIKLENKYEEFADYIPHKYRLLKDKYPESEWDVNCITEIREKFNKIKKSEETTLTYIKEQVYGRPEYLLNDLFEENNLYIERMNGNYLPEFGKEEQDAAIERFEKKAKEMNLNEKMMKIPAQEKNPKILARMISSNFDSDELLQFIIDFHENEELTNEVINKIFQINYFK